jgi:C_GCAxxG_C_C family probable redox protein
MGQVAEEAVSIFMQGYNCAQSVLMACARRYGLDDRTAMRMASAFGGGMTVGLTCGVVTGALMAIGLKHAKTDLGDERPQANAIIKQFFARFTARHSSLL